jgi:hypothetical protein
VAQCETGGSWSENSGNGFYGGLKFTQENWEKYGGLDYAMSPDQASRSQQIAVAEKVLADQGVGVWSTCGLLHGLGDDSTPDKVDTGVADESSGSSNSGDSSDSSSSDGSGDSSDNSDSSSSSGSSSDSSSSSPSGDTEGSTESHTDSTDSGKADSQGAGSSSTEDAEGGNQTDKSDNSTQNGNSSVDADSESSTGRHRGGSADESAADARTDSESPDGSSGRHASRGGDAAREAVDGSYVVRVGDNLTAIADSLGLDGGWRVLYAENESTVGTDPDLILPGQTLEVGAETGEKQR